MKKGNTFVEVMIALVLLALMMLPLFDVMVAATRTTSGGNQRTILELRARRHQAEIATTTYGTALSMAGRPFPIELGNPADQDGHGKYLRDIREGTVIAELTPGLMQASTQIAWDDASTRHTHEVKVVRLYVDPTLSLRARYALTEVQ